MMTAGQNVKKASRPGPIGLGFGSLNSKFGSEHDREQGTGAENEQRKADPEWARELESRRRIHRGAGQPLAKGLSSPQIPAPSSNCCQRNTC